MRSFATRCGGIASSKNAWTIAAEMDQRIRAQAQWIRNAFVLGLGPIARADLEAFELAGAPQRETRADATMPAPAANVDSLRGARSRARQPRTRSP